MLLPACLLSCMLFISACESQQDPDIFFLHGDYTSAFQLWRDLARKGDHVAQQKLAMLYYLGLGVDKDFDKAFEWYAVSARAGNAQAQWNLGSMYASGLGVEKNLILAYGWFYQAELNGNPQARGYMDYLGGKITPNQTMQGKQIVNHELHMINGLGE